MPIAIASKIKKVRIFKKSYGWYLAHSIKI